MGIAKEFCQRRRRLSLSFRLYPDFVLFASRIFSFFPVQIKARYLFFKGFQPLQIK